ncbi:MAG: LTA synthase family protein [bacterium]
MYKHQRKYLVFVDVLLTVFLLSDAVYLRFYNTLPVLNLIGSTGLLIKQIPSILKLFNPTDLFYIFDFFILLFILIFSRKIVVFKKLIPITHKVLPRFVVGFTLLVFLLATLILAHDSQQKLPYLYGQISENKVVAKNIGVFGAHAIDVSRNFDYFSKKLTQTEKNEVFANIDKFRSKNELNKYTGLAKGKRVVMIQVESLNNALIDASVDGQEITPNLNKLTKSSNYYNNHTFTIGAGGTSDTDFSVNTSIYPLLDSSIFVKYGRDNFTSLEKELKSIGYQNYAYHANSRGYWNRNTVFTSLGFDKFYAEDNYVKGMNLNMGLNDKDFLNQAFDIVKSKPVNSFHYIITLTSHFSFDLPDNQKTLSLNNGDFTNLSANYLQSMRYTDTALGNLIDNLKKENIYDDALIVLYGDHTAKYDAMELDTGTIDPNTEAGKSVPLLIKLPSQNSGKIVSTPSSHLDIMPTILNLVGTSPASPMFGRDLFGDQQSSYFTSSNENNFESILMDNYRYLSTDKSTSCKKNIQGKLTKVSLSDCSSILDKRNTIQNTVNKLVKYNLFDEYLKQN